MSAVQPEPAMIRRQLARILASPGFRRNQRQSCFLQFIVERHLEGRPHELKEAVLAVEVFGRAPDYNPKQDAIVRAEAGRLRARLDEYYRGEGKDDAVLIELPKGGYVPSFHVVAAGHRSRKIAPARWTTAAVFVLFLFATALLAWWATRRRSPITIAVVPLENLNRDPADDYLADGLTDELIRNLSMIEGLTPRSRTSSFALKSKPRNIREAGKALNAEYMVEGSVLRSGRNLRVDAQLIRANDDVPLWSGRYDREVGDALSIQEEISLSIVNHLRLSLGRGRRRYETSAEAYDLYLRARALDFRESVGLFQQATVKDASFAPAFAGLAATYAYRTSTVHFDRADELAKMRAAAERAVELDPLLSEAHDAFGMAYAREAQWNLAEASFRQAIALDRNASNSYRRYAMYVLLPLGRKREAVERMRIAQNLDPLSRDMHADFADALLAAGMYGEAATHCLGIAREPAMSMCLGRTEIGQGKVTEARARFAAAVDRGVLPGNPIRGYLAFTFGRTGERARAEQMADAAVRNPYHRVLAYLGLGDRNRALEALLRMEPQGPLRVGWALACPELVSLKDEPIVKALRKRLALPE